MDLNFFDRYERAVSRSNTTPRQLESKLLRAIHDYLKTSQTMIGEIIIEDSEIERSIFFKSLNIKLNCIGRLVFSETECLQEITFSLCDEQELTITAILFSAEGLALMNSGPKSHDKGFNLYHPSNIKLILTNILERLYSLGVIQANSFTP